MKVALLFRNPRKIAPYEHALRLAGLEPVHVTPADRRPLDGLAGLVLAELAAIGFYGAGRSAPAVAQAATVPVTGNTEQVGWLLYTSYLIPFEIASMLLLVAMIGAIVLAKREL